MVLSYPADRSMEPKLEIQTLSDMTPDTPAQWTVVARCAGKARAQAALLRAKEDPVPAVLAPVVHALKLQNISIYDRMANVLDQEARTLYALHTRDR